MYDLHLYYAFAGQMPGGDTLSLATITSAWSVETLTLVNSLCGRPAFAGEWSLGIPLWSGLIPYEVANLTSSEQLAWKRIFALRQISSITRVRRLGGFFWSWYSPSHPEGPVPGMWSFERVLDDGVLTPGVEWAAPSIPLVHNAELGLAA